MGGGAGDRHKRQRSETRQKGWAGKVSDKLSSSREKSRHKHRGVCAWTRARREAQRVSRGAAGVPQEDRRCRDSQESGCMGPRAGEIGETRVVWVMCSKLLKGKTA